MKKLFLIFFLLTLNSLVSAQDTSIVHETSYYSSKNINRFNSYKIKYGEKHMTFPDSSVIVEWCYFLDSNKRCFDQFYKIINDTIIQVSNDSSRIKFWNYFKNTTNDTYNVIIEDNLTLKQGEVQSLIPFELIGKLSNISKVSNDTLWIADYSNITYDGPNIFLTTYKFPKSIIQDTVFAQSVLDKAPQWANGDSITLISLERNDYCINEPTQAIRTLKFIIDKNGVPRNFEQYEGNFHLQTCPFYFNDLVENIMQRSPFMPGEINGIPVNSICYLKVDMMNDYYNEFAQHPALDHDVVFENPKKSKRKRKKKKN